MPRDSLFKAVAAPWSDTMCSQTRKFRVFNFWKEMVVGFQPWTCWSFSWPDLDLVALNILKNYLFWQHSSVLLWTVMYGYSMSWTIALDYRKISMWGSNPDHNNNFRKSVYLPSWGICTKSVSYLITEVHATLEL